ncbi:MAG: HEAT repeat domain-containing protein [Lentisphaeria bacterium]
MNNYASIFTIITTLCIFPECANAQPTEQRVRDILLTSREVGGASFVKEIHSLQQQDNISDETMRGILNGIIMDALNKKEDPLLRELTGNAIRVVSNYGNESVRDLLGAVIERKNGTLRRRAVESYMRVTNHAVAGVVTNILTDTSKYDDLDRRVVYEELINSYQITNKKDKTTVISVLDNAVDRDIDKSNFVLLDRFLKKAKNGYADSPQRTCLLRKHTTHSIGSVTEIDKYVSSELSILLKKTPAN